VWRADGSGEPVVLRGHDDRVWGASFSPDGKHILSESADGTVRVWRADSSGEPVVLRGHDGEYLSARFSSDGKYIVSGGSAIRIWRADGTGSPVILTGHTLPINDARFSPDGLSVVSASDDGTVRVWRDLAPVALDDPRLWTATTYCMPIDRRIDLLGVSEEQAKRDLQRCVERVEQAHRAEAARTKL
jgi:WD40 repeat protein